MTDVLPPALRDVAAAVRRVAATADVPLHGGDVGASDLSAALERYARAAVHATDVLAGRARSEAQRLDRSADEYLELEALLIPRALR